MAMTWQNLETERTYCKNKDTIERHVDRHTICACLSHLGMHE